MNQTPTTAQGTSLEVLETLRGKTTAELSTRLHHLAFEFLEAKKKYEAKRMEQALYQSARELHTDGIWVGDIVRVEDEGFTCKVVLRVDGHVELQPLIRGKEAGLPLMLWEVGRVSKIN